jgi:hypothetical protein
MQFELQCQKCEESFSVDFSDLGSDPTLRCPGCGARAPAEQVETLVSAVEELCGALAPLRRKFTVSVEVSSEELPPPFDEAPAAEAKGALLEEEEGEEQSEDEGEEDEEDESPGRRGRDLDF